MAIGNIIFELRTERNLSQKKLAEILGISQSAIAQIEKNRNEATASTIRKLANFFQVSTDFLLEIEDDFGIIKYDNTTCPTLYTKEEQELVKEYRSLTSGGKQLVHQVISAWKKDTSE